MRIKPPITIASGADTVEVSPMAFNLIKKNVSNIFTVTDDQLIDRMKFCAQTMKMVVEPTGALALAGAKHCGLNLKGKRIGIIVSGGNIDIPTYAKYLS